MGEQVTKAATDKIKIAGDDVTKAATDKIKIAGEDVTKAASDKITVAGEDVTKAVTDKISVSGEDATRIATDKIKIAGEDVTKVATDKIKTAGEDITKVAKDKIKIAGEDVTKAVTDKIMIAGEDVTKAAKDKIKIAGEDVTKVTDKISVSGEDATRIATDKIKIAGDDVTKAATDKIKIAGEDVTKAASDKITVAGEDVTKAVTDKISVSGEDATRIATDKIKIAGEDVTKVATDKIKTAGEDITKVAKDKIKIAGEDVTKAVTDKIMIAGEDVTKAAKDKIKIAGEDVTKVTDKISVSGEDATRIATDKIKIACEDVTKVATDKIKTAGEDITKVAKDKIKIAGEDVTKAVTDKIMIAGEDVTKAAKDKIKIAGEDVTKVTKEKIKIVGEDVTKAASEKITFTGDNVTKTATDKITIAGDDVTKATTDIITIAGEDVIKAAKDEMNIAGEDVTKAATDKIKIAGEDVTKAAADKIKIAGKDVVKAATDKIKYTCEDVTKVAKDEIKIAGQMVESRIKETGRTIKEEIKPQQNKPADEIYDEMKHELQRALAQHYWTEHDSMPLSPMMPEIDDKLTKFYIAPKMNKMDTNKGVDTYKALFYDVNDHHRNIYIQGEAGKGKTTFCTKLGLVWSEIKFPEGSKKDSSIEISTDKRTQNFCDESVINEFDFVFSLALRNVNGECQIERMIETQIISELPDCTKYDGLVPKILDKERCLIILDGLDEWSHQRSLCKKSSNVPHRKSWSNTTVLTSARPWKMNEVCLRDSEISILIQITGTMNSETFIEKVLNCLNDKYQTKHDAKDFITYMKDKQLKHLQDTPVVAMQLLWLWHSGQELSDSKCNIYLNMLGMLFGRAEGKPPSACDDIAGSLKAGLPPCFESTEFCEQHKMLLDCLGSLAFHTLYSSKNEETLVFNESIVKSHVKSLAALSIALKTGILSEYKSPSRNKRSSHFSFLHKTFQEFLAAYYIATDMDQSENIKTLFQVYGQTVDIMDISELFIFVCGRNTEMSYKISDSVMKLFSVKLTNHIEELHVSGDDYDVRRVTRSLQEMILAGYKESIKNGHQDPQLDLHHVHYSHRDSKYYYMTADDEIYRDTLVDRNIDKIVTLSAGYWREPLTVDIVKIQQILTRCSSTLSHVSLGVEGLTDACLDLFTNITLKYLYLRGNNTHFDIKLNTSSLLYCGLWGIHKEVVHSVLSALTTAPKLHTLDVPNCQYMSLLCQVLPTLPMLHRLHVTETKKMIPFPLCQVMSTLSQLQRLTVNGPGGCEDISLLCQLPSTLSHLQYIKLHGCIDLGDNDILLPNSIQEIELQRVTLTCRSFRQLVDRLTQIPHKVTCTLGRCTVRQEKALSAIVKHIQESPMF